MKNTLKSLSVLVDVGTIALCAWSIYKTLRPAEPAVTFVHVPPHEGPTDVNAAPTPTV